MTPYTTLFVSILTAATLRNVRADVNASSQCSTWRYAREARPEPGLSHLLGPGAMPGAVPGAPGPPSRPSAASRLTERPRAGGDPPLVQYLLGNLLAATAAPDTEWAATVEKQRCFLKPGSSTPVANLLRYLAKHELDQCDPALLWDASLPAGEETLGKVLAALSRPYVLARTPTNTVAPWLRQTTSPPYARRERGHWRDVLPARDKCRNVIAIVDDVMAVGAMLGNLSEARVVVVTRSPKWRILDYLSSPAARQIRNLLIVHDRAWRHGSTLLGYPDLNLYTHHLFWDSLGSSVGKILTSWRCDHLTRPTELFPLKMLTGFAGHQFTVSASDTPPFIYKKVINNDGDLEWDGIEIRLLRLLSKRLNFTINIREAIGGDSEGGGSAVRVVEQVSSGSAELGAGGIYVTQPRLEVVDMAFSHTQDCAAFITMASVALPRYRAIMGPFQWTVWLALTVTYMLAILPLVYSHSFSLKILIKTPGQIENMFWYVFGTFTNAFSFKGRDSWTSTSRTSTRMIIGWYWVFSIIVTACYTGCIISFIAFPAFPSVVEYIWQLWDGGYRIGTLRTDGWSTWFLNSSDPLTDKLLKDMETVPTVWDGLVNMTKAYFWHPYAFLGSRLYLEHVVSTNYTAENKRSLVHVTRQCLAPFGVSLIFPKAATFSERFDQMLMRMLQSGITEKMRRDVRWDVMRSKKGRALLQVSSGGALRLPPPEERMLTLDDTQGMFLLLGAGFAIAVFALLVENCTGRVPACRRHCQPGPRRRSSVASVPSYLTDGLPGHGVGDDKESLAKSFDAPSGSVASAHSLRRRCSSLSPTPPPAQMVSATAEVHAEGDRDVSTVRSVFTRVVTTVAASMAFRKSSLPGGDGEKSAAERRSSIQQPPLREDQVLHLSNAWSDCRSSEVSDGDDAHLKVVRSAAEDASEDEDTVEMRYAAGRCRRGSVYPRLVAPGGDDHDPHVDGPSAVDLPSAPSSIFGSRVEGSTLGGLSDEDAEDSATYILLRSPGSSHCRPGTPMVTLTGGSDGQLQPLPTTSTQGHRRRSSIALCLPGVSLTRVGSLTG